MPTEDNFLYLMAIGDGYGMKYEFQSHEIPIAASDLFYDRHPKFLDYQIAHYTDDTQKSLGNAELLLKIKPEEITADDFIASWLQVFKRETPRPGYSKYMYKIMCESTTVEEFRLSVDPSKGVTSGGAMGAAVLGVSPDLPTVIRITELQTVITHNTKPGRNAALGASVSAHFLHHGGSPRFLENFLDQSLGADWCSPETGRTDNPDNGLKIVRQALNALSNCKTLSEVLINSVSQDKVADTDTICALAMALASRQSGIIDDLPTRLHTDLEDGAFGSGYLKKIDARLSIQFPRSQKYASYMP